MRRAAGLMPFSRRYQGTVDRQPPQGDAGRGIDRVAQRRRPRRHAGLADAAGRLAALDDVNLDLRRLIDAQHAVVVEIGLLDPPLVDGDLAIERRGEAEDQAAFELRHDGVGIDGDAGIDRRGDAAQMHLALLVDFGLHHGRDETAERRLHADATSDARRQRLAPAGFFRHEVERRQQPRVLPKHRAAEIDRILARLARQLVHEAFDGEHVVVGADPAPEPGRHRRRFGPHIFDMEIGNVVGHVDRAIDGVDVDAFLERRRQPARQDRPNRRPVFPADDLAVRQARGDRVAIDRAIDIVLDVFLAGPYHLHRPVDLLGDANGRDHHVGLEPAAEAAAEQMVVDDHLLDRKPGGLRRLRLHPGHDLRAGPDFAGIRLDMNGGVQRLHRRMGEKRQLVGRIEPVAGRKALGDVAFGFGDRAILFARGAQISPDVFRADGRVRALVPVTTSASRPFLAAHM